MPFKPSLGLTVALFAIGLLFAWLGNWQLDRQQQKQQLFDQFEQAPLMAVEQALRKEQGFARVQAFGHFDSRRHVLLDNQILNGRVGVHVLTPFFVNDRTTILVNRGWLPMPPDRRTLPVVPTEPAQRTIAGILRKPSTDGQRLGDPDVFTHDQWPQLVTYLDLAAVAMALDAPLEDWLLQLEEDDPAGFAGRQWKAAVMEPSVHRAYAIQWFSLMVTTFIIWLTMGVRRGQLKNNHEVESGK
jgi:surfeit locus 1 family protein